MAIINVIEEREEVLDAIKHIKDRNPTATIKHAIIWYNTKLGTPDPLDYNNYPLKLIGTLAGGALEIRVLNVSAGSKCKSSILLKEILNYFDFKFKEEQILTSESEHDNIIRLLYVKEDDLT